MSFISPTVFFCFCSFVSESIFGREYCLLQGQLNLPMQLGGAAGPVLPDPSERPYSSHMAVCSVLPFLGIPQLPLFFFFNSLSRMLGVITFMHICLTSMFLSSGPKELVGSVQIPNSRVFQSLPFIWIVYQIILLLSMAQVMFTSKHVYKQLLHVKYSGFP